MTFYYALLQLSGAVMLLLWAIRMLRVAVERGHGQLLFRLTNRPRGGWPTSALTGVVMAGLLQSSTAVTLLVAAVASSGTMPLATALATVLGADVGSALILQFLAMDLSWLPALLALCGGALYLGSATRRWRQTGKMGLAVALIMISLGMIGAATEPLRDAPVLVPVVQYLASDVFTAFLLGAAFTWLVHSSIASVLMIATFHVQGILPYELGLLLVLGANVGGGLVAVGLTIKAAIEARRIALGNLVFKLVSAVGVAAVLHFGGPGLPAALEPVVGLVQVHLLFNLLLLVLGLPTVGLVAELVRRTLRIPRDLAAQRAETSRLDPRVLADPLTAEACVKREMLAMARVVEEMLDPIAGLFEFADPETIQKIKTLEKEVDRRNAEIKHYLARISYNDMEPDSAWRCFALAEFAVNLEFAADLISTRLVKLARSYSRQGAEFRREDWDELFRVHARVCENLQLALNVMINEDCQAADRLLRSKRKMAEAERELVISHMRVLREESIGADKVADIHLETMRAMRQINSMVASIAVSFVEPGGAGATVGT